MFKRLPGGWGKYLAVVATLALLAGIVANPVSAALPDTIAQVNGTAIVVGDCAGDYAGDLGSCTDQITLTGVLATEARESDKIDFGINRAQIYTMRVAVEFAVAPTSGDTVDYYIGWSNSATAGTANPGGLTGSDADYTGTAGDSLADSLAQVDYIGSLFATADATAVVQFQDLGTFKAPQRYGTLVVDNSTGQNFHSDDVEMGARIDPLELQVQE